MSWLQKIFGDANQRFLDSLKPQIEAIKKQEAEWEKLSDQELKNKSLELKQQAQNGTDLNDLLVPAFALVKLAAQRTLNQNHYDVQLLGGIVLHQGQIAEMKTGEGKTLTSTLAIYLNALSGKGVHVVTVNDYLAKRDATWMGQIYDFLGLSIGIIQHNTSFIYDSNHISEDDDQVRDQAVKVVMDYLKPVSRSEAYQADITYGTNNEFGFDYLRDNMAQDKKDQVQRDLTFAIVDEVDSILIDEARTPLIISAPAEESASQYQQFSQLVNQLVENTDYNIDEKMRTATLTEDGVRKVEKLLGVDNIYETHGLVTIHHLEQALRAKAMYHKDKDYIVRDGEIVIIDEFTGRMMEGRRYSEGLHQAIEAKEGVQVQRESMTLATITFQNYFRMYEKLSGMTGTAATEAEEMAQIYSLDVTVIPTNKPFSRQDLKDQIFKSERGKFKAIAKEVAYRHQIGQPVLIGTASIEKNELLAQFLEKEGLPFNLLNAKNHAKEAEILAQAGKKSAITVATNMAGRGVDIILGGVPFDKAKHEEVKSLGGLHVLGSERHESRRIDNQLRGRAGRQGDVGSSQFFISLDDDLMRIFGSERIKSVMNTLGLDEETAIENKIISRSIESAQRKVEGHNFDIRKHLVEYDDIINKHRQVVYKMRQNFLKLFENAQSTKESSSQDFVLEQINKEIEEVVSFHTLAKSELGDFDPKEIIETIKSIFPLDNTEIEKIKELLDKLKKDSSHETRSELIQHIIVLAKEKYLAQTENINQSIEMPESGFKPMQLIEKGIVLRSIDTLWVEHLTAMDKLRTGIGLQGYGQRDPLVEYKREAFTLFNNLLASIRKQIVYSIFKVGVAKKLASNPAQQAQRNFSEQKAGFSPFQKQVEEREQNSQILASKPKNEEGEKVGRNDLCPCGSGKKYKKCHGA
ncbi:preprotein translocase subunit SecA [Candidatus Nomurabacteria bacterium]|nr:preprotein translocase subunit SecA [Candidatus Nomurabacteria bacterium]